MLVASARGFEAAPGSQKDRIAFAQVKDALRRGFDGLTVASCGNYGAALALASSVAGLRCEVFVPAKFHTRRIEEIEGFGARIERSAGDYEHAVSQSQRRAETEELYDANPARSCCDVTPPSSCRRIDTSSC